MENFWVALDTVLPLFLMIGIGCFAKWRRMMSDEAVRQANGICFTIFMPILLFYNVYSADLTTAVSWRTLGFCMLGSLTEFLVGIPIVKRMDPDPEAQVVMLQNFFRSNAGLLAIPIAESLYGVGNVGVVAVLAPVFVASNNVLAVLAIEMFRSGKPSPLKIAGGVIRNPLVLGAATGIVVNALGLHLPSVALSTVKGIAGATTPVSLVMLGASLNFSKFGRNVRNSVLCVLIRLAAAPSVMLTAAVLLGFRNVELAGIMMCFGAPLAVATFSMTVKMHGDADLAGELIMLTTAFSSFTLFLWILILKTIGVL